MWVVIGVMLKKVGMQNCILRQHQSDCINAKIFRNSCGNGGH
jgi:hypothetical protein